MNGSTGDVPVSTNHHRDRHTQILDTQDVNTYNNSDVPSTLYP